MRAALGGGGVAYAPRRISHTWCGLSPRVWLKRRGAFLSYWGRMARSGHGALVTALRRRRGAAGRRGGGGRRVAMEEGRCGCSLGK